MVIGNEESQKVYIGIDGQPGDQWIRTKRGWRISESEDDPGKDLINSQPCFAQNEGLCHYSQDLSIYHDKDYK